MNTQTYQIPETVKIETLAKWLDKSDPKNPQIRFTLAIHGPHGRMECPYSGGILAFLSEGDRNRVFRIHHSSDHPKGLTLFAALSAPVRTLYDLETYGQAVDRALSLSRVNPPDVIHSLIRDAQAGDMSFPDFCGDFGYDEDSRKAFQVWHDCQALGAKFRKIVGRDLFAAMESGLQDY